MWNVDIILGALRITWGGQVYVILHPPLTLHSSAYENALGVGSYIVVAAIINILLFIVNDKIFTNDRTASVARVYVRATPLVSSRDVY